MTQQQILIDAARYALRQLEYLAGLNVGSAAVNAEAIKRLQLALAESPDSTSYPFLAIARRYSIDYGMVLNYADACEKSEPATTIVNELTYWESRAVRQNFGLYQIHSDIWRALQAAGRIS